MLKTFLVPDNNADPELATWTELPGFDDPLFSAGLIPRTSNAAFSIGPYLYVAGGLGNNNPTQELHVLGDSLFAHLSIGGAIGP